MLRQLRIPGKSLPHSRGGNNSLHALSLWALLIVLAAGFAGCDRVPFLSEPTDIRVEAPKVSVRCPARRHGADLALLADDAPIPLAAEMESDPLENVDAVVVSDTSFRWESVPLSSPSDATGEFGPEGRGTSVWWAPPSGGFFSLRCVVTVTCSLPRNVILSGAARKLPSGAFVLEGTGEILVEAPTPGTLLEDGTLDGVPLGPYPNPLDPKTKEIVRRHADVYRVPRWFYRVDDGNRGLRVSEHFTLGEFDMTYDYWKPDYPVDHEYIALDPLIIDKLEMLLDSVRASLDPEARFEILAGYRSPAYNEDVKREDMAFTQTSHFSMHMYGRAADLIVDKDADGRMDDLSGDGVSDLQDVILLRHLVDAIDLRNPPGADSITGGCGIYPRHDIKARAVQTPYLHIDVRGYWGDSGKPVRWEMP